MEEFCELAGFRAERRGERVLDEGTGLGGAAFHFEKDFDHLMSRWEKKDRFCREGILAWGCFTARVAPGGPGGGS
jgi:hypothetical protein